ncbi:MAG: DUF11 domain-containing protein, partial [Methanotrichaceae archaeon]|nr:DUF11 domain-containing protein [Methanotrichaceae archaeon]
MNEKVSYRAYAKPLQIILLLIVSLFFLSNFAGGAAHLSLEKTVTTNPEGTAHEGTVLTSTYTVRNTGDSSADGIISNVVITDEMNYPAPGGSSILIPIGDLQWDQATTKSREYTVTELDACSLSSEGGLTNTATAQGLDESSALVTSNTASQTVNIALAGSMLFSKKSSSTNNYAHEGDNVEYTFTVRNPSYFPGLFPDVISIHDLVVEDNKLGTIVMDKEDLAPGEMAIGTGSITIPTGITSFSNNAFATAVCCVGDIEMPASHTMNIIHPAITITKTSPKPSGALNNIITFTIPVTNTGDSTLNNVVVEDTLPKGLSYYDSGSTPKPSPNPPIINGDGTTTVRYNLGQLVKTGTVSLVLATTVNGQEYGKLVNNVVVNAVDLAGTPLPPKTACLPVTTLDLDFSYVHKCEMTVDFHGTAVDVVGPSFSWDFGDGTPVAGQDVSHVYGSPGPKTVVLTVTDSAGNSGTVTKTVDVVASLKADAGPDEYIPYGGSVEIGGSPTAEGSFPPYTYKWAPIESLTDENAENPIASPSVKTPYTVTVTDNIECTATDTVTVWVSRISVTKTATPDHGAPGTVVTFPVVVTNTGSILLTS